MRLRTVKPEADVCRFSGAACFNTCLLLAPPQHLWAAVVCKLRKLRSLRREMRSYPDDKSAWRTLPIVHEHEETHVAPRLHAKGGRAQLQPIRPSAVGG